MEKTMSEPATHIRQADMSRGYSIGRVLFLLLVWLSAPGCRSDDTTNVAVAGARSEAKPVVRSDDLLDYVEIVTAGADKDAQLPMLVGVHGLGDTPENFLGLYENLPVKCRVILPRAFIPWRVNNSWFDIDLPYAARGGKFADDVAYAADRVAALVSQLSKSRPTAGKPIVSGFSQGGMIAFTLAVNHPDLVDLVLPIGGALPRGIAPVKKGARGPPVRALHGEVDDIVPVTFAKESVSRLNTLGRDATIKTYPGVGHAISPAMRSDLFSEIAGHLK